jgi:DnaJ-class molecular chaperone
MFRCRRSDAFADEVAIDFPSSSAAIEFFRRDHIDADGQTPTAHAEITISADQAGHGAMVALDVHVPRTCACCGGRGEVWSEPCEPCAGRGEELQHQRLTVAVPAGVAHGDRFSFNLSVPRGPRTRVDVRVAVTA